MRLGARVATLVGLSVVPLALGCAAGPNVVRVYDGNVVTGASVPAMAYAAYLEGALAEEAGDLDAALEAYERAARQDADDPEPLTRVAEVSCRRSPSAPRADEALSRALRIDPHYAPALATRARCAAARGRPDDALSTLEGIPLADRSSPSIEALLVRVAAKRAASEHEEQARRRAIALTVASGERVVAWEALIAWGRAASDPELVARGLEGLMRLAPLRRDEIEAGALELLGAGDAPLARRVAASVADVPADRGLTAVRHPTVARLAVDEALLANDLGRAERRATRGHVPLAEVAARALLLERPRLAGELARRVALADPRSGCAAMVLLSLAARDEGASGALARATEPTDRPAASCVLALADRLAVVGDVAAARAWAERVSPAPLAAHDPLTGPLAVDLAARGVIPDSSLPLELRLELAARRREAPPALDRAAIERKVVDAKHALLWHTLVDPTGTPAKALLGRMAHAAERDPIVGFSLARAALAATAAPEGRDVLSVVLRAIAAAPSHPLLLAAAVEIAARGGRAEELAPLKARLHAVARTPAERALAVD